MHVRHRLAPALTLLTTLGAAMAALASTARPPEADDLSAFDGEWLYVEDRTEGRAEEDRQPPMSVTFGFRVEDDAVVMLRGKGSSAREERIPLDGSFVESEGNGSVTRRRGEWIDGTLEHDTEVVRVADGELLALIRQEFRVTPDGLEIHVVVGDPPVLDSVALYRHPDDIELPRPARATIDDVEWIAGAWVGTRGKSSIEERWSPPGGGALLGVSRTIKGERMTAFEYLRIVERNAGLVYVAQPGGSPPTEFVLTELGDARAVFVNPRHDFPQRIVYELSAEGDLTAAIGFANGGRPRLFEFEPEID